MARCLPADGPEFRLQLVFGKSTLKRELRTISRWHKRQEVSAIPFGKRSKKDLMRGCGWVAWRVGEAWCAETDSERDAPTTVWRETRQPLAAALALANENALVSEQNRGSQWKIRASQWIWMAKTWGFPASQWNRRVPQWRNSDL